MTAQVVAFGGGSSGAVDVSDRAKRLLGVASTDDLVYEVLADYSGRTDGNPVRVGRAPVGTSVSSPTWTIMLLEYDASGRRIRSVPTVGAWTPGADTFTDTFGGTF